MKPKKPKGVEPLLYDLVMADCAAGRKFPFLFENAKVLPNVPFVQYRSRDAARMGKKTIADVMREATVFVVDDDAMLTALEIRNGLIVQGTTQAKREFPYTLDPASPETVTGLTLPDLALLPFEATWLEYSPRLKVPEYDPEQTSKKVGHLMVREVACVMVMTFEQDADGRGYLMMPYVLRWTNSERWHESDVVRDYPWIADALANIYWVSEDDAAAPLPADVQAWFRGMFLTGRNWLPAWGHRVSGEWHQPGPPLKVEVLEEVLAQGASGLSLLMVLLSLVAWCPIQYRTVAVAGRHVVARQSRRLVTHQTVSVKVPIRECVRYLRKAETGIHKRRHRVREHLRKLRSGEVVIVHEHERGDETLGWVEHDYQVKGDGGGGIPGL